MIKKRVKWGLVGLGLQGKRMMRAMEASAHAELAGAASRHSGGALPQLLKKKDIDAVCITTPNHEHAVQAIAVARARKHILCEKPLALSMREGRAILQAVQKSGVHCFVNYHLRLHPEAQKARVLLAQKKLGDITYIEMQWSVGVLAQKNVPPLPRHMRWRESHARSGGGALTMRGVHLFDLLRFIAGKEVVEVRAWSDATRTRVDRTAIGLFVLEDNTPAVITTSKIIRDADNHITIYGTKGKLVLRDIFSTNPQAMYKKVFGCFAEAIKGKKTPLATLEDGIAAVAIAEAFTRSASDARRTSL
ncbi:MAG: hypothetical protein A3C11_01520 [Candidatus Sungbacteria bacterium RIFCSPHIGHO2_02_FULL_49_12]|uniref:Gfo/Idh/MocA-like oxidoreductase N-terminal domain-containing protein n=1 Tax=Candidatus Sungbacteria bacterium RIFCSPHIGHO2_02_FULL_49_12 TaxID=1802271 RepID=A0A1G2KR28_9BACT|nr:MAG: hypothetical protein A3C11_01520 [Candidatus Sungbacteria bacterium RIFCSPHIGHO2_02_FULL_49_12]